MSLHRVAATGDVPADTVKLVQVNGTAICLAHTEDGAWYAINDTCSHEEFSLSQGELWGTDIECPQHGSRFDLRTGHPDVLPAVEPVPVYPVKVEGDEVYVDL